MKKENTLFKFDSKVNDILEIAYSFQKSRVLLTACELGVFNNLGEEQKTADELAAELDCNAKALERLLNALVSIKLLEKSGLKFANSSTSWNLLVKGNQHYLGNLPHINNLYHDWTNLTKVIKKGISGTGKGLNFANNKEREDFVAAYHWRAQEQAPIIAKMLDLSSSSRLLDLGGGSGAYSMEFIKAFPHLDVTIYDQPEMIKITQEYLDIKGFSGRINTMEGDFTKDRLPKNHYDVIFMSLILHHFSFWECMDIIKNVYDSLRTGGRIIIHEMILNDNRTSPEFSTDYSLNLLVNSKSGDVFTEAELWIMLKESWLSNIEKRETEFGTVLFIGRR